MFSFWKIGHNENKYSHITSTDVKKGETIVRSNCQTLIKPGQIVKKTVNTKIKLQIQWSNPPK